jgi:tellurite resistance protein TehA-like permease
MTGLIQSERRGRLAVAIEQLHPAYFGMVMATAAVSMAARVFGYGLLGEALFLINLATFAVLWLLTLARLALYPRRVLEDLADYQRGVCFFTSVAGTCMLGIQFLLFHDDIATASVLWFVGVALWALITYSVFAGFTIGTTKPTLAEGIHGGWLLAVEAMQACSILGVLVVPRFPGWEAPLLFLATSWWLCGGMLYIWMMSLIFYRYTFFRFSPSDLAPPYWINMGAMAVSTLAGITLLDNVPGVGFLSDVKPFLLGFTLFYWAAATWWLPMVVILWFWRYLYKKFPLTYDPLYWGIVFPLGMYTVCTFQLARVTKVPVLLSLSHGLMPLAILAWAATFFGFLRRSLRAGRL